MIENSRFHAHNMSTKNIDFSVEILAGCVYRSFNF